MEELKAYEKIDIKRLVSKLPLTYAQDVRKRVAERYSKDYSIQTIYNTLFGRTKPKEEVFQALLDYAKEVAEQRKQTAQKLKEILRF